MSAASMSKFAELRGLVSFERFQYGKRQTHIAFHVLPPIVDPVIERTGPLRQLASRHAGLGLAECERERAALGRTVRAKNRTGFSQRNAMSGYA
jgi:hypothetical protein